MIVCGSVGENTSLPSEYSVFLRKKKDYRFTGFTTTYWYWFNTLDPALTPNPNPQGGLGCETNLGIANNTSWHHLYMATSSSDTQLYLCNGSQYSSNTNMNHRFWVR